MQRSIHWVCLLQLPYKVLKAQQGCPAYIRGIHSCLVKLLNQSKIFATIYKIDANATLIAQKERVPTYAVQSWTKVEIHNMLSLGVIEECTESRWICPIHVVVNESKEPRMTIDLRLVNKSIIPHDYPLPKVQDLLAHFSDGK